MAFAVDLTGTVLDRRYRLTGLLGKGGMGYVYEAVHVALDQRVAVKVLHPRYAYEARFRERFLQEARAASKIRHRNVVEIKDFGETPDDSVYFAMEYLHGHDVGAELQEHGALSWARTRNILLQAASALHAAHAKKIIHRDIKPGNCFLIDDDAEGLVDVVKLLDFGIAKVGSDSHADAQGKGLTGTGEVFGTASYMSPEQARGEVLDARSDMYSLGIMAYEMLVGQVPFIGVNSIHVITQHLTARPEPLRSHDAGIPPVVEALVLKMMAKERRDRYASMAEVEHALREIPEEAGGRKTRLWSSPGDLRASVAEKKAAGTAPKLPGQEAQEPSIAASGLRSTGGSGAAAALDAERTEKVVPSEIAGPGGVKRTLVRADRPSAAASMPMRPPVQVRVAASMPGMAAPMMERPAVAPGPAVAPVAAHMPTPMPASPAEAVLRNAAVPAAASSSAVPGATAAPFGAPAVPITGLTPGSGPQPAVHTPMGWATSGRSDGTNPPPGAEDSNASPSTWPPSTASTGPHARHGDTGTETHPHTLQAVQAAGITARTLLVVGLLAVFVGGASVLGTMAFLSSQEQPEPAASVVEPPAAEPKLPKLEFGSEQVHVEGRLTEPPADQVVVVPEPKAPDPSSGETTGAAVEAEQAVDEAAADGGADPVPSDGKADQLTAKGSRGSQPPQGSKHETEKCAKVRETAREALEGRRWAEAIKLAKQRDCWSGAAQRERRHIQVNALLESGQFADCITAGSKATDPATLKMVDICRKRLPK